MQRFNRLFSEALLACLHQHLRCYAIAQIALRNLAYFPGCMNTACLEDNKKLRLPQSGVATHVEERDVDDTSSSKQIIGLTNNLANVRKRLFVNAVFLFAACVMSDILFLVFASSDCSKLIYRVTTRLRRKYKIILKAFSQVLYGDFASLRKEPKLPASHCSPRPT